MVTVEKRDLRHLLNSFIIGGKIPDDNDEEEEDDDGGMRRNIRGRIFCP